MMWLFLVVRIMIVVSERACPERAVINGYGMVDQTGPIWLHSSPERNFDWHIFIVYIMLSKRKISRLTQRGHAPERVPLG